MKSRLGVADAIRTCWESFDREHAVPPHTAKAVRRMLRCRTAALGGHMHRCDNCGSELPVYNSCEDRHCPTCQGHARRKWTARRLREILPVQYFHVVFTLPHILNPLVDANRKLLFSEFFHVVGWVLQRFAQDPLRRLDVRPETQTLPAGYPQGPRRGETRNPRNDPNAARTHTRRDRH